MTIKSILASVFALALFAGVGMTLTTANVSFVPAAYASSDDGSSDDGSSDDGSSDDGSSDDG
ncbi:MAG TPA: cutinase, partial [Mariprofundaceae bacterium]|nr:cutinase [Mariprofundaceae bacterium]